MRFRILFFTLFIAINNRLHSTFVLSQWNLEIARFFPVDPAVGRQPFVEAIDLSP